MRICNRRHVYGLTKFLNKINKNQIIIYSNGLGRVHKCGNMQTDRQTDHAAVTAVAIAGLDDAFSAAV